MFISHTSLISYVHCTAYVLAMGVGIVIFLLGSKRYIKAKPDKKALWTSLRILASPLCCKRIDSNKESQGGHVNDSFVDGLKNLLLVLPATCLTLPFCIVYNQMTTVFIVQGYAMRSVGIVDREFDLVRLYQHPRYHSRLTHHLTFTYL